MRILITNIYSISVLKEVRRVVKVRVHRLVEGTIVTISSDTCPLSTEISETDDEIIVKIKKNYRTS
jgi:hypothetical protein